MRTHLCIPELGGRDGNRKSVVQGHPELQQQVWAQPDLRETMSRKEEKVGKRKEEETAGKKQREYSLLFTHSNYTYGIC